MALLEVRFWPDPVLRQKGRPVEVWDEDLRRTLMDMAETMYAYKGIGLAAQQVGLTQRIMVCDVPSEKEGERGTGLLLVTNPRIVRREGEVTWNEGCLSFPGLEIDVNRAARVRVVYQDERGVQREIEAQGLFAVCLQHEIDHLDGIVFTDRLGPVSRRMALREYERLRKQRVQGEAVSERRP